MTTRQVRVRRLVIVTLLMVMAALYLPAAYRANSTMTASAATPTTYHVDCNGGKDSNSGTSPSTAWQTLSRANKASLQPGDSLLFKRECSWTGPLNAKWTGTATAPILIGAYGTGAAPLVAHAKNANVIIRGAYQIIEGLQTKHVLADYPTIASNGQPYGWKLGVTFIDAAHHNTLRQLRTSGHALGVNFGDGTHHNRVLDSYIGDNFGLWSNTTAATGVLLHGDANEIAYNRFEHNAALKVFGKGTSLEVYNSTRGNIHHNVSYDRQFAELGSGAIISADNVFAYNTHWSDSAPSASGKGARFIVTRGPGCDFGPVWRTVLLNNTVYLSGDMSEGVVAGCTATSALGAVLTMKNNIIVATEKAYSIGGGKAVESHNLYWTPGGGGLPNQFLQGQAPGASSMVAAPKFVNAAGRDVHLQATSPAINAGSLAAVNAGYTTDLDGTPVPTGAVPEIGVDEVATVSTANNQPLAAFTYSCADLNCSFDGAGSSDGDGAITSYAWDFGDGTTASGVSNVHSYAAAGTFSVTLTVTDDDGATNATSQVVTVDTGPSVTPQPLTIQAEDYRAGGAGVGYHDTTAGNTGEQYRQDDVDINVTTDTGGGYNVGWIAAGEWLAYDVDVVSSGTYTLSARVAALYSGKAFHIEVDGVNVTGSLSVPETGGWQNWTTVTSAPVTLSAGTHVLTIVAETLGFNLNYLEVLPQP